MSPIVSERDINLKKSLSRCSSTQGIKFSSLRRTDSRRTIDYSQSLTKGKYEDVQRSYSVGEITRKKTEFSESFRRKPIPNNNNLLQSVLNQNYNLQRVSSASNISDHSEIRSKLEKYKLLKHCNSNNQEIKDLNIIDISPITIIQDEYNTRMPNQAYDFQNPDNSFKSLSRQNSGSDISLYMEAKDVPVPQKPDSGTKVYDKMNKFIHIASNSVYSLIPSIYNSSGLNSVKSGVSTFQSESDNESDNELEEDFLNESLEITNVESPKIETYTDFKSIQKEIEEFQSNFINKFDGNTNNGKIYDNSSQKMSRIQKKILDYKYLYGEENTPKPSSVSNIGSDYNIKIQNEKLINQYHSIRLRFSKRVIGNKDDIQYNSGLMGYMHRVSNKDNYGVQIEKKKKKTNHSIRINEVTIDNKDEFLQDLWNSEYLSLFPNKNYETSIKENEYKDIYSTTSISDMATRINISEIARNINIS